MKIVKYPFKTPEEAAKAALTELQAEFGQQITHMLENVRIKPETNRAVIYTGAGFSFEIEARFYTPIPSQPVSPAVVVGITVPGFAYGDLEELLKHNIAAMTLYNVAAAAREKWERYVLPFINTDETGFNLGVYTESMQNDLVNYGLALLAKYPVQGDPADVLRRCIMAITSMVTILDKSGPSQSSKTQGRVLPRQHFNPHFLSCRRLEAAGILDWITNDGMPFYTLTPAALNTLRDLIHTPKN